MAIPASKLSVLAESFSLGKLMHKYANMRKMNFDRGKESDRKRHPYKLPVENLWNEIVVC